MTLETDRLILRSPLLDDAEPMFRNWASDPEVTRYLTWPAHSGIEISRMVVESWINEGGFQWMMVLKELNEPIGSINVVGLDNLSCSAELGYCIGRPWWHKGITAEALGAVIDFLFTQPGISRVFARHDVNNPHSGAVMRKCGMIFEGRFENGGVNNTGICDVEQYGISKII